MPVRNVVPDGPRLRAHVAVRDHRGLGLLDPQEPLFPATFRGYRRLKLVAGLGEHTIHPSVSSWFRPATIILGRLQHKMWPAMQVFIDSMRGKPYCWIDAEVVGQSVNS
jgi:hypothetical protein